MRIRNLRLVAVGLAAVWVISAPAMASEGEATSSYRDGEVMVQLRDGSWERRVLDSETPFGSSVLEQASDLVDIEPMRVYRQLDAAPTPADPIFPHQWHLQRHQAWRAWPFGDGSGVTVAVIDSGVADISDLACHTYVHPYDARLGLPVVPSDSNGHGTFVTSVLAECSNNGLAGAGTAPGVDVMPIGVLDPDGAAETSLVYAALYWALDHGADIVNLSLGFACEAPYPTCRDLVLDSAIADLVEAGVVIVSASGNSGTGFVSYPANHPNVIAVGSSGYDGRRADYSTFGRGLTLLAPTGDDNDPSGRNSVIQQGWDGLEAGTGTSYAAPQVSGALAILRSAGFPSLSHAQSALYQSAQDVAPSGYDTVNGYGDLRIRDALAWGGAGITPPIRDAAFHAAGDFTGDGRADALTYDGRFGRWWVLRSAANGFVPSQWDRFSTVSGWTSRLIGDFDGDDRDDLANFHPSNGTWWVSRSTGSGFATTVWDDFSTASGWGTRLVGDFDGDDRDDIANFHPSNGTWWVSRSTGSGFTTTKWADFSTASGWKLHLTGDFTGDGLDDIASFHPSNGTWWVSRSTGSGFVTTLWADFTTATGWASHLVGDFDGDDDYDIANFHPSNGTWWVSRSTGARFDTALWADFTTAAGWTSQMVGDFDGDEADDIANYYPGNGTWWVSRSVGSTFSTALWADYATAGGWTERLVGDFNGDGSDDLADHHRDGIWVVDRSAGNRFAPATWFN